MAGELPKRVHFTTYIESAIAEEVRDAVDYLSGPPDRMTLSKLVTEALTTHLGKLRRRQRDTLKGFPRRPAPLRKGRNQRS